MSYYSTLVWYNLNNCRYVSRMLRLVEEVSEGGIMCVCGGGVKALCNIVNLGNFLKARSGLYL